MAIGAQNAFVLRLGIDGERRMIALVVSICAVSDAVLITAGALGIGALIEAAPVALIAIRIVGSGFLIVYGLLAARRAFHPAALVPAALPPAAPPQAGTAAGGAGRTGTSTSTGTGTSTSSSSSSSSSITDTRTHTSSSTAAAALTAVALTWLNPHVYLDTVVFLGSVANQQGPAERWWWVGGAILASFLWFFGLGFGARLLRPVFARPRSWQVLDALIAAVMLVLGIRLALGG
ncbi:amino acid transporter [Subtercola boreus]|uniref:Amino acid transporter n=1 Tax=Subtercola boreus TaxID=120213 RepID=A0A3E0WB19_9MICO|nr:amino acid transporter [Subtercola boreus]RFA19248.1 amino acid transporter [Subtercola boreus]RFA25728.1 amino acid transporter [Subtercola boreus]